MILILGGTSEGRAAADVLDKAGKPFIYSTLGGSQQLSASHAMARHGMLDAEAMTTLCREKEIRLIVDAAHPFAVGLHATVAEVAISLGLPVVRYERRYPKRDPRFVWCDSYADACRRLKVAGIERLLCLTGANTIKKLKPYWAAHDAIFRILRRNESIKKACDAGFPKEKLIFLDANEHISDILATYRPDAIITKESGDSGGFDEKTSDALEAGVEVYVVKRPSLPASFITVTGEYGLRREVERLVAGFFDLRSGFTTGSCATAAAKAALLALLGKGPRESVSFTIPNGEVMSMPVAFARSDGESGYAEVVKEAGDDPDVTQHAQIGAEVRLATHGGIRYFGGEGVGKVTLPGLGLPVGDPAINVVPRQMIADALLPLAPQGCDVTISVAGGEELAEKTFNPRVGVVGGISIVGTSGIVMPLSHEAFVDTIRREMEVAAASGVGAVVINSGARSEKTVKRLYPDLPPQAFVHYGNAIGETLAIAEEMKIPRLIMGVMIGKAVKLAEGNMDTHSHKVTLNKDFLCRLAQQAGCKEAALGAILGIMFARELPGVLSESDGRRFFAAIEAACRRHCQQIYTGAFTLHLLLE